MLPTWLELRIAMRTLRRSRAFAVFSVLALALAITANTTMSSLIDGLVFPEVGFPEPGQLYVAHFTTPRSGLYTPVGIHDVLGDSGRTYSGETPWRAGVGIISTISVDQHEMQVPAAMVGGKHFRVLGSHPLYGSLFRDSTAADRNEAVISERLWRRISGGRRAFAPFALSLTGGMYSPGHGAVSLTVIGVIANNGAIPPNTDLFMAVPQERSSEVLLRLRHGVTAAEALRELDALAPNIDPAHNPAAHFTLMHAALTPARNFGILVALVATTLAVLLIACANIANLLLARGMARSRELATRFAFGASRWQVGRLLFAESGMIAAAGGVLGLVLSLWTVHLVRATLPAGLQYYGLVQPQLSWRVLAAGVGFTVVAAVVFGLVPIVPIMRAEIGTLIKGTGSRRYTESGTRFRWLVVVEVAGALTLVVSATMLGAAAGRVHLMDLGYNASNLISATVNEVRCCRIADGFGKPPSEVVISKRRGEMQALRDMPGITSATAWWYPGLYPMVTVDDPGGNEPKTIIGQAVVREVSPNYLRVMGIPIVRGRDFHDAEDDAIPSVIIDTYTAHWLWPGANPLGRLVKFASNGTRPVPWMRVVGIAKSTIYYICDAGPCPSPTFYVANGAGFPAPVSSTYFIVRAKGAPQPLVDPIRAHLAADYPNGRPRVETWADMTGLSSLAGTYDFITTLFGSFSFVGLLLALIGVYGMAAYAVEQRTREFGVRIALGAQARDIIRLVLREGNATALLGLAIGLIAADWLEGLLQQFLFGYDDQALYFMAGCLVALFATTVLAGVPPALRAARIDPVDTLRAE